MLRPAGAPDGRGRRAPLLVHTGEQHLRGPLTEALARAEQESAPDDEEPQPPAEVIEARATDDGWLFAVSGTGLRAVLRVRITDLVVA